MPTRVFPKKGEPQPHAHLLIKDCGVKDCKHKRPHYHTLNPRGQAMKSLEMTVRRSLKLIEAFSEIDQEDGDWQDLKLSVWREVFGRVDPKGRELPELWDRYKKGTLQQEVLNLVDNLVLEDLPQKTRKEIKDGLKRIES